MSTHHVRDAILGSEYVSLAVFWSIVVVLSSFVESRWLAEYTVAHPMRAFRGLYTGNHVLRAV